MERLIQAGADTNVGGYLGRTILHRAVQYLLERHNSFVPQEVRGHLQYASMPDLDISLDVITSVPSGR